MLFGQVCPDICPVDRTPNSSNSITWVGCVILKKLSALSSLRWSSMPLASKSSVLLVLSNHIFHNTYVGIGKTGSCIAVPDKLKNWQQATCHLCMESLPVGYHRRVYFSCIAFHPALSVLNFYKYWKNGTLSNCAQLLHLSWQHIFTFFFFCIFVPSQRAFWVETVLFSTGTHS